MYKQQQPRLSPPSPVITCYYDQQPAFGGVISDSALVKCTVDHLHVYVCFRNTAKLSNRATEKDNFQKHAWLRSPQPKICANGDATVSVRRSGAGGVRGQRSEDVSFCSGVTQ